MRETRTSGLRTALGAKAQFIQNLHVDDECWIRASSISWSVSFFGGCHDNLVTTTVKNGNLGTSLTIQHPSLSGTGELNQVGMADLMIDLRDLGDQAYILHRSVKA